MNKNKLILYLLLPLIVVASIIVYLKSINLITPVSAPSEETPQTLVIDANYTTIFPIPFGGYLANPGMGWQKDTSKNSDYFPETVAYLYRTDISWRIINPASGVYDWTPLDAQAQLATLNKKQFSFRVFTMIGEEYGGHQVPNWVIDQGAVILPSGEPDYSNCVYQQEWGRFVNALLNRYDGDANIAYIDISGYGDFNEWGWLASQTEWDVLWEKNFLKGKIDSFEMETIDSAARRRLADMFIGGSQESHLCRMKNGTIQTVNYLYDGAQKTQLIMPYAGIVQSSQYVYARKSDVGFRYDCLGREHELPFDQFDINWKTAPIVYEFCGPNSFQIPFAETLIQNTHPILIHNNAYQGSFDDLQKLMEYVGYRYVLKEASVDSLQKSPGNDLSLSMLWKNTGTSPAYPKMGQNFQLHVYLLRQDNQLIIDYLLNTDISKWIPAHPFSLDNAPLYRVDTTITLPSDLEPGTYTLKISIADKRTNMPIQIAVEGVEADGKFPLFDIYVE